MAPISPSGPGFSRGRGRNSPHISGATFNFGKQFGRLPSLKHSTDQIQRHLRGDVGMEHVPLFEHGALAYPADRSAHSRRHEGISGNDCHTGEPAVAFVGQPVLPHMNV